MLPFHFTFDRGLVGPEYFSVSSSADGATTSTMPRVSVIEDVSYWFFY